MQQGRGLVCVELIALLDAAERVPVKRGAYRKTRERKAELRGEISN